MNCAVFFWSSTTKIRTDECIPVEDLKGNSIFHIQNSRREAFLNIESGMRNYRRDFSAGSPAGLAILGLKVEESAALVFDPDDVARFERRGSLRFLQRGHPQ